MALWKIQPSAATDQPRPVLFLDRDGVVNADRHYLADPAQVELLPGVAAAMLRAREAGFWLVGVSNQSGLGRGRFTQDDFQAVMEELDRQLTLEGVSFDAFFYCPHAPGDNCQCRKPLPGLLQETSRQLSWIKKGSWVVGDKISDVALGRDAGIGGILVLTGYGQSQRQAVEDLYQEDNRVRVLADLQAAVDFILSAEAEELL